MSRHAYPVMLCRTALPSITAVASLPSAYAKRLTDTSDENYRSWAIMAAGPEITGCLCHQTLKALGVDPKAPGRSAITGRGEDAVWDFLSLADRPKRASFTSYPHLTLGIHTDHLNVAITIPNGVIQPVRRRLIDLEVEGLIELNAQIMRGARRILSLGGEVQAYALQRHYMSQRSPGITDAMMYFALDISKPRRAGRVKRQLEWTELFADLLRGKRANIQFGYVARLPWET
jgi:hypothetical protein